MEINIEKATDFEKVISLHKQIFHEDNKSFFESIQTRDYYITFVATHNNLPVAYCIISEIAGEAEIINIGTLMQYRKEGIAARLLEYAIESIQSKTIFLEVSHTNESAIKLYKKCGFIEYGRRKKYYGDTDAILMKKQKN